MPLWGNPLLLYDNRGLQLGLWSTPYTLRYPPPAWAVLVWLPQVQTIGSALLLRAFAEACPIEAWAAGTPATSLTFRGGPDVPEAVHAARLGAGQWCTRPFGTQNRDSPERIVQAVDALCSHILPTEWVQNAERWLCSQYGMGSLKEAVKASPGFPSYGPPPAPPPRWSAVLERAGWKVPSVRSGAAPTTVSLSAFPVRKGTLILTRPFEDDRKPKLIAYADMARGAPVSPHSSSIPPAGDREGLHGQVLSLLHRAWSLPPPHHAKTTLWLLVNDGFTQFRISNPLPCPCGCPGMPSPQHCFWECSAAQQVVAEIQEALCAAEPGAPTITRWALWMAAPPAPMQPLLHLGVWTATTVAALAAMEVGRRQLTAAAIKLAKSNPHTRLPQRELDELHLDVRHAFWACIEDICRQTATFCPPQGRVKPPWYNGLSHSHPIIHIPSAQTTPVPNRP